MSKKAIITILLVPESEHEANKQINKEIRETLECGWLAEIQNVQIEESQNCMVKKLRNKGLSKNVATNIVSFYSG